MKSPRRSGTPSIVLLTLLLTCSGVAFGEANVFLFRSLFERGVAIGDRAAVEDGILLSAGVAIGDDVAIRDAGPILDLSVLL